ncbi:MAG: hypothetical protein ACERLG_06965 [Sedimentibacter sp.]
MENQIKKMYTTDCVAIISIMAILWTILTIVMFNISGIVENQNLRMIIFAIGILVGAFATASSVAVIIHLKKNQNNLYKDEIIEKRK